MEERPWVRHYDPGVPVSIDYPKAPLFYFLEESARKYPERACTIFKGAVITYKEMSAITDRIAVALAGMGVKKGDRVGIFMPNTPQFVMAYYGILKAGGVVVATNPLYTPSEIEYQASDAGIEVMFVMTNFYHTIKKAQPNTRIKKLIVSNLKEALPPVLRTLFTLLKEKKGGFRLDKLEEGDVWLSDLLRQYADAPRPAVEVGPEDVALFQYSGGTTGISKGAVALHRNVVANTLQIKCWMTGLEEGRETVLMAIPLFHVYQPARPEGCARKYRQIQDNRLPGCAGHVQRDQQPPGREGREVQPWLDQGLHLGLGAADARDQGALRGADGRQGIRRLRAFRGADRHPLQPAQRRQ
jgi:long-chain acyl-CoA synthetase